jgi:hypothetical protein
MTSRARDGAGFSHRKDLLDGIRLFKPIAMGIRHLAFVMSPPEGKPVFALWCGTRIAFNPALTTEYNWDCETCFEEYEKTRNRK